jgi:hypothetical protein
MRNTQGLKDLIVRWRGRTPSKELLYDYKPFCSGLLHEDEEIVRDTTSLLRQNIQEWATLNSLVYSEQGRLVSKSDLIDHSSWHVKSVLGESMRMATNGSTTGRPFPYLRWEPFLYFIEAENHYDLIMDEFGISEKPKVMYLFDSRRYDPSRVVTVRSDSDNFMEHHGLKRRANVHYVNFGRFKKDRDAYLPELIDYIAGAGLDVIFAPGPSINALCSKMRKSGSPPGRMCRLMSNSNEMLRQEDASFLLDGRVDHMCDHMRCWDGGATFFTCKNGAYHLLDNLSWCEEVEGKLVSTDYFSLPSPFVRYWNGDFCRISDRYERCECGRLYRDFEFIESRPFSIKGRSILEIKDTIESLGLAGVEQVRCSTVHLEVVSRSPLKEEDKRALVDKLNLGIRFVVEE